MKDNRGRTITLTKLFSKEVVNVATGERLGYINDAEVDISCGEIMYFCASEPYKKIFKKKHDMWKFAFEDISKIGDDIILINSCTIFSKNKCENSKIKG